VPTLQDLAKNASDRAVLEFIASTPRFRDRWSPNAGWPRSGSRPCAAPRRDHEDAEFLAEAARSKTDIADDRRGAQKIATRPSTRRKRPRRAPNALIEGKRG